MANLPISVQTPSGEPAQQEPQGRFRSAAKRFISDPDDPLGHLAFSLFIYEIIDRDQQVSSASICQRIETVSQDTISGVYFAAANRLLTMQLAGLVEKEIDRQTRRDQLFTALTQHADFKHETLSSQVEHALAQTRAEIVALANTQTFIRQASTSAAATILVILGAAAIIFGPDLVSAIRKFIGK